MRWENLRADTDPNGNDDQLGEQANDLFASGATDAGIDAIDTGIDAIIDPASGDAAGSTDGNQDQATRPVPLPLAGGVRRTFNTPGFAGITFYEIRAKSIINHVPGQSRVPFEWTLNPYRGCTHACMYCLSGDTPIRMADGRTKPIARVRVGDKICGTERAGRVRRYATTTVLAHWKTVKPAFRVRLENGTDIVASGDHRFLTDRGWKHVAGATNGLGHWPFLVAGDVLMGTGFAGSTRGARARLDGCAVTAHPGQAVVSVDPLGVDMTMYDITTGTGDFVAAGVVSHNCYARNTHTYLDLDAGHDFDTQVVVKVNAPELLRRELSAPRWSGAHIAMGTNVDCYQRAEGKYRLMPGIIEALRDFANPFSILTKGTLILRDLPLLVEASKVTSVGLAMTIGFVDEALWRSVEPGTPSPRRRLDAVRALADAGFGVSVMMAPILPGITDTDESIDATMRAIASSGAASVIPIPLHLRPGAREWYLGWLGREHPDLVGRYRRLFGSGSYQAAAVQRDTTARVRMAARRYGMGASGADETREVREAAERQAGPTVRPVRRDGDGDGSDAKQLSLW